MIYRTDSSFLYTREKILRSLMDYGPLGVTDITYKTGLHSETVSINCKALVKEGLILRLGQSQKGKYKLVEQAKLPTFLSFRGRNKILSSQIMNAFFAYSKNRQQLDLEHFARDIGIYILYVLMERIRPEGPWTINRFKSKIDDPRMKDINLLRDTWLIDTIDSNLILEQFNKYINAETSYQEFEKNFESIFPNFYEMIMFHKNIDERRKKNIKNKPLPQSKTQDEDEINEKFAEDSQNWLKYLSQ